MKNFGYTEEKSKRVIKAFQDLYPTYLQYVEDKMNEAAIQGYVTGMFGLRCDTPAMHKALNNSKHTPKVAEAEKRTAGNLLGQSVGMLTQRAAIAFMDRVWRSQYRYLIFLVAFIHDAIYLTLPDDPQAIKFVNKWLIHEMRWQDHDYIRHDQVKMESQLDLHRDSWAEAETLPNED
jgi:DNA polymerase-1